MRLQINDGLNLTQIEVAGMKDGETYIRDLRASLPAGNKMGLGGVTVNIIPLGKPGGTAAIVFGPNAVTPQGQTSPSGNTKSAK